MGFLDRFKSKKKDETPAEPPKMHSVTVNLPSYFKAGDGEYHVIIDGQDNVCRPFSKLVVELPEGTHSFRAFSTPETLGDVTQDFDIQADTVLSVTVDVRNSTISINVNDKLRSKKEFEEQFKKANGVRKEP